IISVSLLSHAFFSILRPPPTPTLFPYTTLFRSDELRLHHSPPGQIPVQIGLHQEIAAGAIQRHRNLVREFDPRRPDRMPFTCWRDRKSTRLNSSHDQISYAVFCLKKKKKIKSMR